MRFLTSNLVLRASGTASPSSSGDASSTATPSTTPTEPSVPSMEHVVEDAPAVLRPWLSVGIPVLAAIILTALVWYVLDRVLRRHELLRKQVLRLRAPVFCITLTVGLVIGTEGLIPNNTWARVVSALLSVAIIGTLTWLAVVLLSVFETSILEHYETDDNPRKLAKLKTQITLLRRVVTALVLIVGIATVLLLIPAVQKLGTTLLASAGLASVVVGLAVQGVLANVFAGLQVAFTDAIRVDDVVVVEAQQGKIAEITLTYVVVAMADGRNMILPSTYFTTQPFENWSRNSSALNGKVVLDLNWNAPVDRIRQRVTQLLEASDLWDGRENSTDVTDAIGGKLTLTITVSARNSADVWKLRNMIREKIVAELQEKHPGAFPQFRPVPPAA